MSQERCLAAASFVVGADEDKPRSGCDDKLRGGWDDELRGGWDDEPLGGCDDELLGGCCDGGIVEESRPDRQTQTNGTG